MICVVFCLFGCAMETENKLQLGAVFIVIADPRQKKVDHDLLELLVVAVCSVLVGADTFVEIEHWAEDNLERFSRHLKLENAISSHDTFGRVFAAMDTAAFSAAFQRWVKQIVPSQTKGEVVAIDGKITSFRQRTTSPNWPIPCGISLTPSRPPPRKRLINSTKLWTKTMAAWRSAAAMSSTNSTACMPRSVGST